MAAFKEYVRVGFWKGVLLKDTTGAFRRMGGTTMGAAKVTSVDDLPPDMVFVKFVRAAIKLNVDGVMLSAAARRSKKPKPKPPAFFLKALKQNPKALATFQKFSPSHQREYVEWLVDAKQEATREKRSKTAIEWLAAGKPRHWKYIKKK